MAATPKTGTVTFTGKSGRTYGYSIYNPDVSGSFLTWNLQGAAGASSVNFISAPEDMVLSDASVVTGIVDTTMIVPYLDDGVVPGNVIQWANVVNTLPFRNFPRLGIKAGRKVQFACA